MEVDNSLRLSSGHFYDFLVEIRPYTSGTAQFDLLIKTTTQKSYKPSTSFSSYLPKFSTWPLVDSFIPLVLTLDVLLSVFLPFSVIYWFKREKKLK
ncbi:MAG: hypothetical protein ACFFAU_10695 [Candidatus Hodarchaeota archaeon]